MRDAVVLRYRSPPPLQSVGDAARVYCEDRDETHQRDKCGTKHHGGVEPLGVCLLGRFHRRLPGGGSGFYPVVNEHTHIVDTGRDLRRRSEARLLESPSEARAAKALNENHAHGQPRRVADLVLQGRLLSSLQPSSAPLPRPRTRWCGLPHSMAAGVPRDHRSRDALTRTYGRRADRARSGVGLSGGRLESFADGRVPDHRGRAGGHSGVPVRPNFPRSAGHVLPHPKRRRHWAP